MVFNASLHNQVSQVYVNSKTAHPMIRYHGKPMSPLYPPLLHQELLRENNQVCSFDRSGIYYIQSWIFWFLRPHSRQLPPTVGHSQIPS